MWIIGYDFLVLYSEDSWMDGKGSIPFKGKRFVSSPQRPDRL
jgi:hypothetical protein